MVRKINLNQILKEIKEDEQSGFENSKRWASQDDIKKMLLKKKMKDKKNKK
jgi:hypothetical protein